MNSLALVAVLPILACWCASIVTAEPAALTPAGPQHVPVSGKSVALGRASNADIKLVDQKASGTHAVLTRSASGYVLTDQGGANGTFVNG